MWRTSISFLVFWVSALPLLAEAPQTSLRPVARDVPQVVTEQPSQKVVQTKKKKGFLGFLRPKSRSRDARRQARLAEKGAVCGDIAIQGAVIGRVPGKIRGCGVEDAVRVRAVSGVALSQQSVMDCGTARALKSWIDNGLKPAVGKKGGGVQRVKVAAHYACRTRNSRKGARISEHGKGRAIDISAITLRDGSEISVLRHWGKGTYGRILQKAHAKACGPFGTVLGPNADRYHQDHFHFDTARYRSGKYCR